MTRPHHRSGWRPRRALLLENIHADAGQRLARAGFTVEHGSGALGGAALLEAVADVEVLGIRSRTQITKDVVAAAPRLRAVGAFCVGTNQIDLTAARDRGIAVFNAPHANTRSVAELALCEIIALVRRLPEHNAAVHAGRWTKTSTGSHEARGRCLGIVGYGNIGAQLSVLAEAVGLRVVFYDVEDRLPIGLARRCTTLAELLTEADVVSVHVDGRAANSGLIGAAELAAMRPGSILLNLARGSVVDLSALHDALAAGHLAGAALDVFPTEPVNIDEALVSDLRGMHNVILTPHVAGSTEEAQQAIGVSVAEYLCAYLDDESGARSRKTGRAQHQRARAS